VQSSLAFDIEGTPNFFGLAAPADAPFHSSAAAHELPEQTDILHDFKFTEAFCSKSTRDLTEAFEKVTKTTAKKMAAGLMDEADMVNLFDVTEDDEMM
jgi:hypothetical protein